MSSAGRAGIAVALLMAGLLIGLATVQAQDGGVPPLPVIYGGEVYVDGVLLMEEAELTVRMGDWESRPVTVQDGKFLALVAGPPGVEYVDQPITFHLNGMEAVQQFVFPLQGAPSSETVRLEFGSPIVEPTATPTMEPEPTATLEPTPTATQEQPAEQATPSPEADAGDTEDGFNIPWATLAVLLAGGIVLLVVLNLVFRRSLRGQG